MLHQVRAAWRPWMTGIQSPLAPLRRPARDISRQSAMSLWRHLAAVNDGRRRAAQAGADCCI